jgi:signal recognition particle receptor subunit beta
MVLFNHATREMTAKIVYYGPGLCGKTTNLMVIFDKLDPKQKGKMLSLATKTDRTLFFDLLPVDIGRVGAFNLKIQLYTVPGQVFYNETRKLVLKGADAVVFVADSQPSMIDSTRESFANLLENLEQNNIDPNDMPIIVQFNKRDIPGVLPVEQLQEALGLEGYPYTEAAAIKGEGVMETFHLVSKITAKHLYARLQGKPIPVEKAKPAAAKAEVEQEPEPEQAAPNPFTESVPFPESQIDSSYDRMEEVSLEQLLSEGRERPATMSGNVPLPVDFEDVEELDAEAMVEVDDTPVAVLDEPAGEDRISILENKVALLQSELDSVREEHRLQIEEILGDLGDLSSRLRSRIDS